MTSPIYNLTDTWNAGGTVFTAFKMVVTDTAYAAGSKLIDISSAIANGSFTVDVDGNADISGDAAIVGTLSVAAGNFTIDVNGNIGCMGMTVHAPVTGITAFAGGGQGSATLLTGRYNVVETVATAADSVKLPLSPAGKLVVAINIGANSMELFPQSGHSIDISVADTPITIAPNGVVTLYGISATNWRVIS